MKLKFFVLLSVFMFAGTLFAQEYMQTMVPFKAKALTPKSDVQITPSNLVTVPEALQHKLLGADLNYKVSEVLYKLKQASTSEPVSEYITVFLYFANIPDAATFQSLNNLGVKCYKDTWIGPMENHPLGFFIAQIPASKYIEVLSLSQLQKIDFGERLSYPNNNTAATGANVPTLWSNGWTGNGVKVAILDSGFDVVNPNSDFTTSWVGANYSAAPTPPDNKISNIWHGVTGHGTHVAGTVLGLGTLSASNTGNGGGAYKGMASGATPVFLRIGRNGDAAATETAEISAMQAAVNAYQADILTMSYGGWDNYHDGSNAMEQTVDWVYSQDKPFFISAGNNADDSRHYMGTLAAGAYSPYIQVNVAGASANSVPLHFNLVWVDGNGEHRNLRLFYYNSAQVPYAIITDYVENNASESIRGTEARLYTSNFYAPAGSSTYYIRIYNPSSVSTTYHVYEDWGSGNVTFASPSTAYTTGTPSNADHAFSVAAWVNRSSWTAYDGGAWSYGQTLNNIAGFSSNGPRIDGTVKPNISAPGSVLISVRDRDVYTAANASWVDNDGTIGGNANYYVMQGTSMACPVVAGVAALLKERCGIASAAQIYNVLRTTATVDGSTGAVPNGAWGYGKVNATAASNALTSYLPGPTSLTVPTEVCEDADINVVSSTVSGATGYSWLVSGPDWSLVSSNSNTATLHVGSAMATVTVSPLNNCGTGESTTFSITPTLIPQAPTQIITTLAPLCPGTDVKYTIAAVSGADTYTWSVTGDWSIVSQSNLSCTITVGTVPTTIGVTSNNECGSSSPRTLVQTPMSLPNTPTSISKPALHCVGTIQLYSCPVVSNATSYNWIISGNGWSKYAESTTNQIYLIAGNSTATIQVAGVNACGAGSYYSTTMVGTPIPSAPVITPPLHHCINGVETYTCTAVGGATHYIWTVTGEGWTGESTSNSINITAGWTNGVITCQAINDCGESTISTITITPETIPPAPARVVAPAIHCYNTSSVYSVPAVATATSYDWSLSNSNWSFVGGTPTGTSANITAGDGSCVISVRAVNYCGTSEWVTFTAVPTYIPATPGTISQPEYHCAGKTATYSIAPVQGATYYIWTVAGEDWSGESNTTEITLTAGQLEGHLYVSAANECGVSPQRSVVLYPIDKPTAPLGITGPTVHCNGEWANYSCPAVNGATAYYWEISGNGWNFKESHTNVISLKAGSGEVTIRVTAANVCGESPETVTNRTPHVLPETPASISTPVTHCEGTVQTYSCPTVSGATSYQWTVTGTDWSITGTSKASSVQIIAGTGEAAISVCAVNECGNSSSKQIVKTASEIPAKPAAIQAPETHAIGQAATYRVEPVYGATSYIWTITGTGWSGSSTTNEISITAGSTAGTISVKAANTCGESAAQSIDITPTTAFTAIFTVSKSPVDLSENVTITYIGGANANAAYSWNFDGGVASPGYGAGPHQVHWTSEGTKSITLFVTQNGVTCNQYSQNVVVQRFTGVDESTLGFNFSIVPNPNDGTFQLSAVQFPSNSLWVEVYNSLGSKVYSNKLDVNDGQLSTEMNLGNLQSGSYYMKLRFDGKEIVKQLVIVK